MKKKKHQPEAIIGWKEWIALPELGIPAIKAKIDTGARTSAMHVFDLEEFEDNGRWMVNFGIHPLQRQKDVCRYCQAPVLEQRRVKDSSGHSEKRFVIQTRAVLGEMSWPIDITLTNRDLMLFRMLLGRKALENKFLVNPDRPYLTGRSLAKAYQNEISKKDKK
ncbi:MAG: RimK/LysX family protein [Desulfobacterales bacterium]